MTDNQLKLVHEANTALLEVIAHKDRYIDEQSEWLALAMIANDALELAISQKNEEVAELKKELARVRNNLGTTLLCKICGKDIPLDLGSIKYSDGTL